MLYHTVSQLEVHNIKAASAISRSASADTKTIRSTPDPPALQDTSAASTPDQFAKATRLALKMQSVQEQLDSVLVNTYPLLILIVLIVIRNAYCTKPHPLKLFIGTTSEVFKFWIHL